MESLDILLTHLFVIRCVMKFSGSYNGYSCEYKGESWKNEAEVDINYLSLEVAAVGYWYKG